MGKNMILTEEGASQFRKMLEMINHSLLELMAVAEEMIPEKLLTHGLKDFLTDYCSMLESESHSRIILSFPENWTGAGENLDKEIYRIIRTLLSFFLENPKATVLHIDFNQEEKSLSMRVLDNFQTFANLDETELTFLKSIIELANGDLSDEQQKANEIYIRFNMQ